MIEKITENIRKKYNILYFDCDKKKKKSTNVDFSLTHCEASRAGGFGKAVFEPVVLS